MTLSGNQVSVGELVAQIVFRTDTGGLDRAQRRLNQFQGRVERGVNPAVASATRGMTGLSSATGAGLGGALTRVNPAIIGATAALGALVVTTNQAVRAATALETAQARLRGNVGLAIEEIDAMRPRLRALATDFGISEVAATNALFPIVSAGFRGSEALDILEVAARGSAAGLGNVDTIAAALITTIQAYGPANITAAQALDTLTAAATNSINSPEELAGVLELVIGQAAAAEIEFDELTASFAAMSRTSQNASRNAAGMRQIIQSLTQPTTQATEVIESLGISTDDLRRMVADDLLGALQFLERELEGNTEAFGDVFGSVEAYNSVLALLGSNAEETRAIFEGVTDATGSLDRSFAEFTDTTALRTARATAQISNIFADIGALVLPAVASALEVLTPLLARVSDLFTREDSGLLQTLRVLGAIGSAVLRVFQLIWRVIQPIARVAGSILGFLGGSVGRVVAPSAFTQGNLAAAGAITPAPPLNRIALEGAGSRSVNVGSVSVNTTINASGSVDSEEVSAAIARMVGDEIAHVSRGVIADSSDREAS